MCLQCVNALLELDSRQLTMCQSLVTFIIEYEECLLVFLTNLHIITSKHGLTVSLVRMNEQDKLLLVS